MMPRPFQRDDPVARSVVMWLLDLARVHEMQPDSPKLHIHLSHPTRHAVYMEYVNAATVGDGGAVMCAPAYFQAVWKRNCAHIKVRRIVRFSICGECAKWRVAMYETRSLSRRKELAAGQREHMRCMRLERHAYWVKRHTARRDPTECISLIIDGADQAKYKMPSAWTKVAS